MNTYLWMTLFALADAVGTVGVGHHRERLVGLDERVDQDFLVLVMDVIVARTVHDQ